MRRPAWQCRAFRIFTNVRSPQLSVVPGHVGVIPRQPCQRGTVRADRGIRVEVASGHEHVAFAAAIDVYRDDRVDCLMTGVAMVFPDADEAIAPPVYHPVGVPQGRLLPA